MIKLTDEGGLYILNCLFNGTALPSTLYVQLFTAGGTLADADMNDTRAEASGGGYASLTINAAENTVYLDGGIPTAEWDVQTFTFTGPLTGNATIYGYQVISMSDASFPVLFEELLATPFKPMATGDILKITPKVQLGNGAPE